MEVYPYTRHWYQMKYIIYTMDFLNNPEFDGRYWTPWSTLPTLSHASANNPHLFSE